MRAKGRVLSFLTLTPRHDTLVHERGFMQTLSSPAGNRFGLQAAIWAAFLLFPCSVVAQHDPGPRIRNGNGGGNSPSTGDALSGLTSGETAAFNNGLATFQEVDSVSGVVTPGSGLGPRFNLDSCAGCHAFPTIGGSSPAVNPQIAMATKAGANNAIPPFITRNGPIREARFVRGPGGEA